MVSIAGGRRREEKLTKRNWTKIAHHTRAYTSACLYTHRYVVTVWAVGLLVASARGGWRYRL